MKLLIVAFALISGVLSAPQHNSDAAPHDNPNHAIQVVRYFYDHRGLDGYKFTLVARLMGLTVNTSR